MSTHKYTTASSVQSSASSQHMSFAPDILRPAVRFSATLKEPLLFREAMSALYAVVTTDQRYTPPDKTEYKKWRVEQDAKELAEIIKELEIQSDLHTQKNVCIDKLNTLFQDSGLLAIIEKEREKRQVEEYLAFMEYKRNNWWKFVDPIITVHPDEVFFEGMSIDESMYGKVSVHHSALEAKGDIQCGTTNVDFSKKLYDEFQKIRSSKETRLEIDPQGFTVQVEHSDAHREKKIDVPKTWIRGFTEVVAGMALQRYQFRLHPQDILSVCSFLKRHREITGPRSIRWKLQQGQPITVVMEPWGTEIRFHRSIYTGTESVEIRTWGRRRLHVLERLVPIANHFDIVLLGTGLPFYCSASISPTPTFGAEPLMTFTLGLSGWTANSFSAGSNLHSMLNTEEVDPTIMQQVYDCLRNQFSYKATIDDIANTLHLSKETVRSSLLTYAQVGSVIFDLHHQCFRVRELFRSPPSIKDLEKRTDIEMFADQLIEQGCIQHMFPLYREYTSVVAIQNDPLQKDKINSLITIDPDGVLIFKGCTCTCHYFRTNSMNKGPCSHMIATYRYAQIKEVL